MAGADNYRILLIDLQCISSIDYYITLVGHDILIFDQYERIEKGSPLNRYAVAGANGKILLSVPLLHAGGEKRIFRDVKICNREHWQREHWRTLTSAYRRSPWFEFYEDSLRPMYEKNFIYLLDWNLQMFLLVSDWLGRSWEFSFSDTYRKSWEAPGVFDARRRFFPQEFQPWPIRYRQVFEDRMDFLPGLSILDLIFCEGKEAVSLLEQACSRR